MLKVKLTILTLIIGMSCHSQIWHDNGDAKLPTTVEYTMSPISNEHAVRIGNPPKDTIYIVSLQVTPMDWEFYADESRKRDLVAVVDSDEPYVVDFWVYRDRDKAVKMMGKQQILYPHLMSALDEVQVRLIEKNWNDAVVIEPYIAWRTPKVERKNGQWIIEGNEKETK
jgi:hypothetical protein